MEEINEKDLLYKKKSNQKIMLIYKILSCDLLFYYTISYLFLTNVKGLSTSQILLCDSFYPLLKIIFQFPCTILIQKIGKKNSLILANSCLAIATLLTIGLTSIYIYILANAFWAFGFVIKLMADSNLLYDSIENTNSKREKFTKYESNSLSGYYFVDSITALLTGFLYVVNPFFPLFLSLAINLLCVFLCTKLYEIPVETNEQKNTNSIKLQKQLKIYLNNTIQGFKIILKSKRLRSLILFAGIFSSLLNPMMTFRKSLLCDTNVPAEYFGAIFALMGIIASFSSSRSLAIHKKYKNRTLSFLGLSYTLSIVLSGSTVLLNYPKFFMYFLLLLSIAFQYLLIGPYDTLMKQYLSSFCNSDMRLKIFSANTFVISCLSTIVSFLCSFALTFYSNAIVTLMLGIISFILMVFVLHYMSTRVGLKPEDYSSKDINLRKALIFYSY